jgi:cold-inducible RNA-binding protein
MGTPREEVERKETNMSTVIYVGNLPFDATEEVVRGLFSAYGTVESVNLITDRATGRLRGFGFVDMADGAQAAIAALNQTDLGGRPLTVNLAKPRAEHAPRPRRW